MGTTAAGAETGAQPPTVKQAVEETRHERDPQYPNMLGGGGNGSGGGGGGGANNSQPTAFEAAAAETSRQWERLQAHHAFERREEEFRKRGIEEGNVQSYLRSIKDNADFRKDLPNYRTAYAKFESGKTGIVVVDNPLDIKGGTAFNNNDIVDRMRRL